MTMNILAEICCLIGHLICDIAISFYNNFTPASWRSKSIKGQTVVITGAASGLGRLMSLRMSQLGCRVALIDILRSVEEVAAECRSAGSPKVTWHLCDLSSRSAIYSTCDSIKQQHPAVDILVNNAGIVTGKKFLECPDDMIEKTMAVNAMAHFWLCKAFLPGIITRNRGHIVTIASGAGHTGISYLADYCASKFAAVGFDESLRHELLASGASGVRTTCVCPYYISTGMFDGVTSRFPLLMPIMQPDYVVDKIMQAVLTNQDLLLLPRLLYFTNVLQKMLPTRTSFRLLNFFGAMEGMAGFKGRQAGRGKNENKQK